MVRPAVEERYTVRGSVCQSNGKPLAGAIVHVDDWDRNSADHLFTVRTNADGYYEGQFSAEQFRSFTAEVQDPDLIMRVFNAQGLLLATSLSEEALVAGFPPQLRLTKNNHYKINE